MRAAARPPRAPGSLPFLPDSASRPNLTFRTRSPAPPGQPHAGLRAGRSAGGARLEPPLPGWVGAAGAGRAEEGARGSERLEGRVRSLGSGLRVPGSRGNCRSSPAGPSRSRTAAFRPRWLPSAPGNRPRVPAAHPSPDPVTGGRRAPAGRARPLRARWASAASAPRSAQRRPSPAGARSRGRARKRGATAGPAPGGAESERTGGVLQRRGARPPGARDSSRAPRPARAGRPGERARRWPPPPPPGTSAPTPPSRDPHPAPPISARLPLPRDPGRAEDLLLPERQRDAGGRARAAAGLRGALTSRRPAPAPRPVLPRSPPRASRSPAAWQRPPAPPAWLLSGRPPRRRSRAGPLDVAETRGTMRASGRRSAVGCPRRRARCSRAREAQ